MGFHMAVQYMAILYSDTESSASVSWGVQNVNLLIAREATDASIPPETQPHLAK